MQEDEREKKKEREKEGKIESGREGIQRPPVIHWNILIFHALQEVHRPVVEGGARKIKGGKKKEERKINKERRKDYLRRLQTADCRQHLWRCRR